MDKTLKLLKETWCNINESLIDLPEDQIQEWLDKNINTLMEKLNETYKNGYDTYIDNDIILSVNGVETPISVYIQKNLLPTSDEIISAMYYVDKTNSIHISADAILNNVPKNKQKDYIIDGIWHELTHVADTEKNKHSQQHSDYDSYINSPREFPAFARSFIQALKRYDPELRNDIVQSLLNNRKIKYKSLSDWFSKLNSENKQKFKNLVSNSVAPNV